MAFKSGLQKRNRENATVRNILKGFHCSICAGIVAGIVAIFIILLITDGPNFLRCTACCHLLQFVEAKRKDPGLSMHRSKI